MLKLYLVGCKYWELCLNNGNELFEKLKFYEKWLVHERNSSRD